MFSFWTWHWAIFLWSLFVLAAPSSVLAAGLVLNWQDNSIDEEGFKIERAANTGYVEIASVGPNIQTFTDSGLVEGSTYCYRVRAFNGSGVSSPSNESCGTIPNPTFSLALTKSGNGSGTVVSNPSGINCGNDCVELYNSGSKVSLAASPAAGSTFAGWSGDADCLDGVVSMGANKTCIATFTTQVTTNYLLNVSVSSAASSAGSGSGSVKSNPAGIDCGGDCSEAYGAGTVVSLTAVPSAGSLFVGWTGDSDCFDGTVTMGANKSCTATFKVDIATLSVARSGSGTVSSSPSGINCGTECSKSYAKGTKITLSAKAYPDGKFVGWSGGGCQGVADCIVSLADSTTVSATFVGEPRLAVGVFRPATGTWFFDLNGNGSWDGCSLDLCLGPFGSDGDLPVVGDWIGAGTSSIGVFRQSTAEWLLDLNGNGRWDGCEIDRCLDSLTGSPDSLPIIGDWTGSGIDMLGEVIPGRRATWYLDRTANGKIDSCNSDACFKFSIYDGDLPVAGDWDGRGKTKIGVFRPSTGSWQLDLDGDGRSESCSQDRCVKSFGAPADRPVVGDWSNTGSEKIGVYRPATGEWFLDLNGNGKWDGCGVDVCAEFLGKHEGDLPVVGRW